MNPTKSVNLIEVDNSLFEILCEEKYDEKVLLIQENYNKLVNAITNNQSAWMKIKDKDCYFIPSLKLLFPDPRKMRLTDLSLHVSKSYKGTLNYLVNCSEHTRKTLQEEAEKKGMILPSEFDDEICGFKATPIIPAMGEKLFLDNDYSNLGSNGEIEVLNGSTGYIIFDCDIEKVYSIENNWYRYFDDDFIDAALKVSVHEFKDTITESEIMIKYGLIADNFSDNIANGIKAYSDILSDGIDINNFDELKQYLKTKKIERIGDVELSKDAIESDIESEEIDINTDKGIGLCLRNYYDECDYRRARIQKYSSKWYTTDEGKGHWEIWDEPEEKIEEKDEEDYGEKTQPKKQSRSKKSTSNIKKNVKNKNSVSSNNKHLLKLSEGVIARNPIADVKHDEVVGIDFGTKSTIVVKENNEQIIPLRIGMADYSVEPKASHYENPTVMQFIDLISFIESYSKKSGRPITSWDDLLISHEAFNHMIESEKSIEIASFITDLKQWAGGKRNNKNGGHLIIKDSKGCRYDIENYMNLTEEDIDLIEIYAYYIGLFINNMHTGIYLDYLMSFPETFSKEIKEKIIKSFTSGIKKSIPAVVLEDSECKEEFRVRQGPSEPAAYAACALEQFGIEPTDKGVFYGIFDFGGGTTDYDYGVWKNAPEDEMTYNYIISHYGSGGDQSLGGENILELIAYYVFSDDNAPDGKDSNLDIMRKNSLSFYKPEEAKSFTGTEALNNDSESALLNTKFMMEVLRPIWEEWSEVKKWFESGRKSNNLEISGLSKNSSIIFNTNGIIVAKLSLFSDVNRVDVELNVDMKLVNSVINKRISSGVRNFFEGLKIAYNKFDKKNDSLIHIFLAGNSSKSRRVLNIFKNYVIEFNKSIFNEEIILGDDSHQKTNKHNRVDRPLLLDDDDIPKEVSELKELNSLEKTHFIIYPPLGTEDAREIQTNNGVKIEKNILMAPNGKTGVAFGLVMCREGSMLRVESEIKKDSEIKLNYYIGLNYRKNFKVIFERDSEYGKWKKFSKILADTSTFEFYYTELPEVVNGNIAIKDNKSIYKHKSRVDNVNVDASIYFRFTSPTQLEYVVAQDSKISKGEFISKIYSVTL